MRFQGFGAGIDASIKEASEKFSVDEKILRGFLHIEDGWYGDISGTGCVGPGQFSQRTWNNLAKMKEGKEIGMTPITKANEGKDTDPRRNPHINVMATALLMKDNAKLLKGLPATGENLYMIHNVGPAVTSVIKGSNNVSEKLEESMRQNGKKPNETPTQWANRQIAKYQDSYKKANDWYEKQ